MAGNIFKQHQYISVKTVMTNPIHFIAFGFGSGLSTIAPGTMGSLLALPFAFLLRQTTPFVYVAVTVVVTIIGIFVADKSSKMMGEHDHSGIVIDEMAGILWVFAFYKMTLLSTTVGFLTFRFFDIIKPWPISYCDEHVKGGFGIMLDDLVAAFFTVIAIWVIMYSPYLFWPS